jgi:Fic family protein
VDFRELIELRNAAKEKAAQCSEELLQKFERAFDIDYTHESTAIEGNTLSLIETKAVLEDGLSVGGKSLREIYEVVNHGKAFDYVKKCVNEKRPLTESIAKDIHALLMDNILSGGIYRNVAVRITGAAHKPPLPSVMFEQIKAFFASLGEYEKRLNTVVFAAYTHAEFVKIHPFEDGNGRTSRLLMNYQLMSGGFPAISIKKRDKIAYFEALDCYAVSGNLSPFAEIITKLLYERLTEFLEMQ